MTEVYGVPAPAEEQIDRILQAMADSFGRQLRSPILHWPSDKGLDYQDITFPALDGVPERSAGHDRQEIFGPGGDDVPTQMPAGQRPVRPATSVSTHRAS